MQVPPLGWEDPLEKGMATHSSILAWSIPWTEEPGGLQSIGSQRIRHERSNWACTCPRRSPQSTEQSSLCYAVLYRRSPVCCFLSLLSPLFLISSCQEQEEWQATPRTEIIEMGCFHMMKGIIYYPLLIWIVFWLYGLYYSLFPW